MSTLTRRRTRVCLIHNDEGGACMKEMIPTVHRLDVVEAHNSVWVHTKEALPGWNSIFQPSGARCRNRNCTDIEADLQFSNPLINEMWRTKDCSSFDVAAVEQLARDER